jgi:putative (di)nucleoside polyphosphate hydrolase
VWRGHYRGQEQKWFACRFLGRDDEIDVLAAKDQEFVAWRWVGIDRLAGLIVPFKRPLYDAVVAEFRHLARPET